MDKQTMTNHERRWLLVATLVVVLAANIPTLLGFLTAPSGTVYTGIDSTAPGDVNVYLSYLEQARQGNLVFRDLFTAESQTGTLFNPFWLALGLLGGLLGLPPLLTYLLARLALGFLLLLVIYWAAAFFLPDVRHRRTAWLLASLAGGVGAWAAPFIEAYFGNSPPGSAWPMDLWVSEAFTWLSLHHSPHFLAASILIVATVVWLVQAAERSSWRPGLYAGVSMLLLYSFHPFHAVSLGVVTIAVLLVTVALERQRIGRVLFIFGSAWLLAVSALAYQAWSVLRDPVGAGRAAQNILPTTWPWVTMVSYGFLLAAAIVGASVLWRGKSFRQRMLVAWGAAHLVAIYAPVFFNRRLTHGLNIVLALLAAPMVLKFFDWLKRQRSVQQFQEAIALSLFVVLFGLSPLWVYGQDLSFLLDRGRSWPYYFYLSTDYRDAIAWIRQSTPPDSVVLSSDITGNFIPAKAGRAVVIGHNVETLEFTRKRSELGQFFDTTTSDAWRRQWLVEQNADYLVVGPWETRLGSFAPAGAADLTIVFQRGTVTVYRVEN
ncbi:MAG: hypothetical protein HY421_00385 [Candidatus Kerfeldbacteria bacterium]|nr:hypothetical protein [Candidatus Kerfeldbacteria bacterium]